MSRRQSDKTRSRLMGLLAVLAFLSSALSCVIGYKAIRAVDAFNAFISAASEVRRAKSLLPEGY